jgi:hypothetical protein
LIFFSSRKSKKSNGAHMRDAGSPPVERSAHWPRFWDASGARLSGGLPPRSSLERTEDASGSPWMTAPPCPLTPETRQRPSYEADRASSHRRGWKAATQDEPRFGSAWPSTLPRGDCIFATLRFLSCFPNASHSDILGSIILRSN